jgi:1,2-phenylacetyl-CoA epoxidase catalytic subunit
MTFVSRRSPWMLPPPLGPDRAEKPADPRLRLLLAGAWRPRAFAVSLAGALGRVGGGEPQRRLVERVGRLLEVSEAFAALARERGLEDAETLAQARLESAPLPQAASWAEAALAEATFGRALGAAFADLARSADEALASAARRGAEPELFGQETLAALAEDANNRECLQILVDRWLPAAVRAFGRPGSECEPALLGDRTKPRAAGEALAAFLNDCEARLGALGLWLPDAARMGVTAPEGWAPRRRRRSK